MNFNYDLVTWIDYFIGAFVCCVGGLFIGKILLRKSFKEIKKVRLFLLIPFTFFTILNTLAFDNILKIFGVLIIDILIYKYILEEKSVKIFIYSLITIIILSFSEILFALIISLIDYIFHLSFSDTVSKAIFPNMIIAVMACFIIYILRDKIINLLKRVDKANVLIIIFQFSLTVFLVISSLNYLYIDNWKFSFKLVLSIIIIFGSASLTFSLLKQYIRNKEVIEKHKMLEEYLKTSVDLIEKYSSTLHKYKNNLIIIKGYLKSDIQGANKYIDNILEKMEDRKYSWVKQINRISIDTFRYIIYYKLSKAEELNLKLGVNVSLDVEKISLNAIKINEIGLILDIIGEYFDNAIYASDQSEERELNFDLYTHNNQLIFNISNTFKGDIDLSLIVKNGYTTKGKGHGFGLYDIDKTIKNINILSNKYEIIDNYFVTTLIVDLPIIK